MSRLSYIYIFLLIIGSSYSSQVDAQSKNEKNLSKFKFLYSEALKFKISQNYTVAIQHFEECVKLMPKSSASAYQLSIIYLIQKDTERSLFYINYALEIKPTNEWYILQKAAIAHYSHDLELYEYCYKTLNQTYPTNPSYTYELALIYFNKKKYKNSLKLLNILESDLGVAENISFFKNNIFLELKEYNNIEKELYKLTNNFPDSIKYIDMLGEYYFSMQHNNKSLSTYNEGIKTFPESKRLLIKLSKVHVSLNGYLFGYKYLISGIGANNLSTDTQFKIASLYINCSEITDSQKIEIYRKFVNSNNSNELIENSFISFLLNHKELSLAELEIKNIFKKTYKNFQLWNSLFGIYLAQNRVEELNSATKEAMEYFPNQAIVYFYSGYSYFLLKDYVNANSSLLAGIDYVLDNKGLELEFYLYLAESFHALKKHSKSDFYFDKYLAIDSTNAYLLNNYAYYLATREEQIKKAINLSRKSIEIEPFNSSFLDTYAWIFYLKTDYKSALFYIEKAYKYGGKSNAVICEHYGDIMLKSSGREEAIVWWKESIKLNPKNNLLLKKLESVN